MHVTWICIPIWNAYNINGCVNNDVNNWHKTNSAAYTNMRYGYLYQWPAMISIPIQIVKSVMSLDRSDIVTEWLCQWWINIKIKVSLKNRIKISEFQRVNPINDKIRALLPVIAITNYSFHTLIFDMISNSEKITLRPIVCTPYSIHFPYDFGKCWIFCAFFHFLMFVELFPQQRLFKIFIYFTNLTWFD